MKVEILPSVVSGEAVAPPSKSFAHRYLIGCALSRERCVVDGVSNSDDMLATLGSIKSLGADYKKCGEKVTITPAADKTIEDVVFDCRESGSTLRFFIPVVLAYGAKNCVFVGSERLLERGIKEYENLFANSDVSIKPKGNSIEVNGKISAGEYAVRGDVSSQYATGLMFALAKTVGKSTLKIVGNVESRNYIDMTVETLREFGVPVKETAENVFEISGGMLSGGEYKVEGDWSNAAFLLAAGRICGDVKVVGLNGDSVQGDGACEKLFDKLDGENAVVDVKNCPDLAPILMAYAAYKNGATFENTRRLKVKESDRAEVMAKELAKFGATVYVYENSVVVEKSTLKRPILQIDGHNDHRIVMALSVLGAKYGAIIDGAEAVRKSFPTFFDCLKSIGVNVYEI